MGPRQYVVVKNRHSNPENSEPFETEENARMAMLLDICSVITEICEKRAGIPSVIFVEKDEAFIHMGHLKVEWEIQKKIGVSAQPPVLP